MSRSGIGPPVADEAHTHPTRAASNTAAPVERPPSCSTGSARSPASLGRIDRVPNAGVVPDDGLLTEVYGKGRPRSDWRQLARCTEADPELFYPEARESGQAAKSICAACEVRADCLTTALATRELHGIWGGLTYRERLTLARGPRRVDYQTPRRLAVPAR